MKQRSLFRLMAMLTVWLYLASMAQAGQVITQAERTWAKQAMDLAGREKGLSQISSSNTLAVVNYNNKTGQINLDALQKGMAVMLISDLAKVDKIQVVERIKIQALLEEMGLGASGLVDPATTPQLGKMLGAYYIASGDILAGKFTKIQLNSNILDVPFKIMSEQAPTVGEINELFRMEKEILFNIVKQMNVYLTPEEKMELEKPLSASTAALFALFLGIDYSDRGQYNKAAKLYQEALLEDPNLSMASDALQELNSLGLVSPESSVPVAEGGGEAVPPGDGGGSGIGTVLAVGAGLALVGGGVALAMSGSSSDSGTQDTSTPPPGDTSGPSVISIDTGAGTGMVSCSADSITYTFSEAMNTSSGSVGISDKGWNIDSASWTSSRTYKISWSDSTSDKCYAPSTSTKTITTTLRNFTDTAGNALDSDNTAHQFNVTGTSMSTSTTTPIN